MLDERHVRELCEKNQNIDIAAIREKLNSIRELSQRIVQQLQVEGGLQELQNEIASNSDWSLAVVLCELRMNEFKQIQLRDLQLVPIIIYFTNSLVNYTFIEVLTGEGKTMIIAIIAAIHVLLGRKVDIITTTDVLAAANNNEMKEFYDSLDIRSTTNVQIDSHIYEKDIVYGTIFHFGKDYLKDCMQLEACGLPARPKRICIIDEVDLLALDNTDHLVKVAKPFPGMEMLRYPSVFEDEMEYASSSSKLPNHLQQYSERMQDKWLSIAQEIRNRNHFDASAIRYIKEEDEIIPIDLNSGMIMRGAVFPDGMQQMLQQYQECTITTEILNSVTLSSYGYIKMYDSVCGLTGTLGDELEIEVLRKIFNGASYYRIPPYTESKFQYLSSLSEQIIYLNTVTSKMLYEHRLPTSEISNKTKLIELDVQQNKTKKNVVACACRYRNNILTKSLVELNQIMIKNAYAHPSKTHYIKSLTQEIHKTIDKYVDEEILLINLSIQNIIKKFRKNKRVIIININDLNLLDKFEGKIKLFLFDMTFNAQSTINSGVIYIDEIDIRRIVHDYLVCGRSLLIICMDEMNVNRMETELSDISKNCKTAKYVGVQSEGFNLIDDINPIKPGVVIITTLIGARGTDYQITDELAQNGGLHVICTFIPPNKRIQQQAFGRAARSGQPGSAQICVIANYFDSRQLRIF